MENILFKNKYEITPRLTKKWNSLFFKRIGRHRHWVRLAMTLIFAALAVLCVVMDVLTVLCVVMDGLTGKQGYIDSNAYFALFVILGVGFLVSAFMPGHLNKIRYKNYLKFSGQTEWIQTLCFGDTIEVISNNSVTAYTYNQINFIDENNDCFILWLNSALLLMVYKNAFELGDANSFRDFIKEKTAGSLWTKKQLNRIGLKKQLPRIVLLAILVVCIPLFIFINPYRDSRSHVNRDDTVEFNYQKDMDTIYFAQWDVFRTQEDTDAYKIDLKNNAFYFIGSNAADSKDTWGTAPGDADFRFITDLENDAIDSFFRQTARHGFTNWEDYYEDNSILDGSTWYIKIVFSDGTVKEMSGINKYPETWKNVITDFENLTGYRFI